MTVEEMEDEIYGLRCVIGSLRVENAKLRGVVVDMWRAAMGNMDFAERYAFAGEFIDRMRELGIEVDA